MGHRLPTAGIPTEPSEHFQFYQVVPPESSPIRRKPQPAAQCTLRPSFVQPRSLSTSTHSQQCCLNHCQHHCRRASRPVRSECHLTPHAAQADPCLKQDRKRRLHSYRYGEDRCADCCRTCKLHHHHRQQRPVQHSCQCWCDSLPRREEPRQEDDDMNYMMYQIPSCQATYGSNYFGSSEDANAERKMANIEKSIRDFDNVLKLIEIKDVEVDPACLADPYQARCCYTLHFPPHARCEPSLMKSLRCAPHHGKKKTMFRKLGF